MRLATLAFAIGMLLSACQPAFESHSPYQYFARTKDHYLKFVNKVNFDPKLDMKKMKTVYNPAYPIELTLFQDGKFYYYLENLGDGNGVWKYEKGSVALYAERDLFVMQMWLKAIEEKGDEITINFQDRFSWKYLPLEVREGAG